MDEPEEVEDAKMGWAGGLKSEISKAQEVEILPLNTQLPTLATKSKNILKKKSDHTIEIFKKTTYGNEVLLEGV